MYSEVNHRNFLPYKHQRKNSNHSATRASPHSYIRASPRNSNYNRADSQLNITNVTQNNKYQVSPAPQKASSNQPAKKRKDVFNVSQNSSQQQKSTCNKENLPSQHPLNKAIAQMNYRNIMPDSKQLKQPRPNTSRLQNQENFNSKFRKTPGAYYRYNKAVGYMNTQRHPVHSKTGLPNSTSYLQNKTNATSSSRPAQKKDYINSFTSSKSSQQLKIAQLCLKSLDWGTLQSENMSQKDHKLKEDENLIVDFEEELQKEKEEIKSKDRFRALVKKLEDNKSSSNQYFKHSIDKILFPKSITGKSGDDCQTRSSKCEIQQLLLIIGAAEIINLMLHSELSLFEDFMNNIQLKKVSFLKEKAFLYSDTCSLINQLYTSCNVNETGAQATQEFLDHSQKEKSFKSMAALALYVAELIKRQDSSFSLLQNAFDEDSSLSFEKLASVRSFKSIIETWAQKQNWRINLLFLNKDNQIEFNELNKQSGNSPIDPITIVIDQTSLSGQIQSYLIMGEIRQIAKKSSKLLKPKIKIVSNSPQNSQRSYLSGRSNAQKIEQYIKSHYYQPFQENYLPIQNKHEEQTKSDVNRILKELNTNQFQDKKQSLRDNSYDSNLTNHQNNLIQNQGAGLSSKNTLRSQYQRATSKLQHVIMNKPVDIQSQLPVKSKNCFNQNSSESYRPVYQASTSILNLQAKKEYSVDSQRSHDVINYQSNKTRAKPGHQYVTTLVKENSFDSVLTIHNQNQTNQKNSQNLSNKGGLESYDMNNLNSRRNGVQIAPRDSQGSQDISQYNLGDQSFQSQLELVRKGSVSTINNYSDLLQAKYHSNPLRERQNSTESVNNPLTKAEFKKSPSQNALLQKQHSNMQNITNQFLKKIIPQNRQQYTKSTQNLNTSYQSNKIVPHFLNTRLKIPMMRNNSALLMPYSNSIKLTDKQNLNGSQQPSTSNQDKAKKLISQYLNDPNERLKSQRYQSRTFSLDQRHNTLGHLGSTINVVNSKLDKLIQNSVSYIQKSQRTLNPVTSRQDIQFTNSINDIPQDDARPQRKMGNLSSRHLQTFKQQKEAIQLTDPCNEYNFQSTGHQEKRKYTRNVVIEALKNKQNQQTQNTEQNDKFYQRNSELKDYSNLKTQLNKLTNKESKLCSVDSQVDVKQKGLEIKQKEVEIEKIMMKYSSKKEKNPLKEEDKVEITAPVSVDFSDNVNLEDFGSSNQDCSQEQEISSEDVSDSQSDKNDEQQNQNDQFEINHKKQQKMDDARSNLSIKQQPAEVPQEMTEKESCVQKERARSIREISDDLTAMLQQTLSNQKKVAPVSAQKITLISGEQPSIVELDQSQEIYSRGLLRSNRKTLQQDQERKEKEQIQHLLVEEKSLPKGLSQNIQNKHLKNLLSVNNKIFGANNITLDIAQFKIQRKLICEQNLKDTAKGAFRDITNLLEVYNTNTALINKNKKEEKILDIRDSNRQNDIMQRKLSDHSNLNSQQSQFPSTNNVLTLNQQQSSQQNVTQQTTKYRTVHSRNPSVGQISSYQNQESQPSSYHAFQPLVKKTSLNPTIPYKSSNNHSRNHSFNNNQVNPSSLLNFQLNTIHNSSQQASKDILQNRSRHLNYSARDFNYTSLNTSNPNNANISYQSTAPLNYQSRENQINSNLPQKNYTNLFSSRPPNSNRTNIESTSLDRTNSRSYNPNSVQFLSRNNSFLNAPYNNLPSQNTQAVSSRVNNYGSEGVTQIRNILNMNTVLTNHQSRNSSNLKSNHNNSYLPIRNFY